MPRFSIQSNDMDLIFVDRGNSLWLGNLKAAMNTSQLKEKNIRTVITVATNIVMRYKDMQHKVYKLDDNEHTPLISYFEEINGVIANGLLIGSVLVHCQAGVSRSSSCVIAYLMWSQKWSYEKTFYFVKEKRLTINPNPGFKKQLITYSERLSAKKSTQSELNTPRNCYIGNQKDLVQKLKGMLVKSPKKIIEHLDISSTDEERQMYRLQLAKKLFLNTFQTKLETPRSMQPLLKLSLYNSLQAPQTDRVF